MNGKGKGKGKKKAATVKDTGSSLFKRSISEIAQQKRESWNMKREYTYGETKRNLLKLK